MFKNKIAFLFLLSAVCVSFAAPQNSPSDPKDTIKKGMHELWKECKKNPQMVESIKIFLGVDGEAKAEVWDKLTKEFAAMEVASQSQDDLSRLQRLGSSLKKVFSLARNKGIMGYISAMGFNDNSLSKGLDITVARQAVYDKKAWGEIVEITTDVAIEGSGEGLTEETEDKLGPLVKEVLNIHAAENELPVMGMIASDEQGNTICSVMYKKFPPKDK